MLEDYEAAIPMVPSFARTGVIEGLYTSVWGLREENGE